MKIWADNWGELYNQNEAGKDYKEKIESLEKEMQKLPGAGLMTNYQLSFTALGKPYEQTLHRRKTANSCPPDPNILLDLDDDGVEISRVDGAKRRPAP